MFEKSTCKQQFYFNQKYAQVALNTNMYQLFHDWIKIYFSRMIKIRKTKKIYEELAYKSA